MGGAVFDLLFDLSPNYGSFSGSFTSKQAQVPPSRKKVETSFNPTSLWPPELSWLHLAGAGMSGTTPYTVRHTLVSLLPPWMLLLRIPTSTPPKSSSRCRSSSGGTLCPPVLTRHALFLGACQGPQISASVCVQPRPLPQAHTR